MQIITLTLNPAFDVHCHGEQFLQGKENLARITSRQSAGKGVNISRALDSNGIDNLALILVGQENGDAYTKGLTGLNYSVISTPGRIRENITIHTDCGEETRLSFPGFLAEKACCAALEDKLRTLCHADTVLTVTGRLAEGMSATWIKSLLASLPARLVIDSRSFSLADLLEIKPWLIKPNQEEVSAYLGRSITSFAQVRKQAEALHRGGIENVMISMGGDGALLCCREGCFVACPPKVEVRSTIGAGDSSIAGFLAAGAADAQTRLRSAVAFGTAACMTEGTLPPEAETVAAYYHEIQVQKL